jgi:prepilin-type N-terminal cleavage/methylation domain-containing protein
MKHNKKFFQMKLIKPRGFSLIELSIVILIIGIIVAGIIGGKKLISLSNLTKARQLTNSSPVNTIEDLVFWIESTSKASFTTGAAIDGTTITQWNDINSQLTNKKSLTQVFGSGPTYRDNLINGLPGLAFDGGSSQVLYGSSLTSSDIMTNGQFTIFMVGKFNSTKSGGGVMFGFVEPTTTIPKLDLEYNTIGATIYYGNNVPNYVTGTKSITNNFILSGTKDSGTLYLYINGALDNSVAIAPTSAYSAPITIGGFTTAGALSSNINVGEIIIFSRNLSDFERQQIEQYLSKKWGIKLT